MSITKRHDLYCTPDVIRLMKSRRLRWVGPVARMGERRDAYRAFVGIVKKRDRWVDRPRHGHFFLSTPDFPRQYDPTIAPYSFIHLPPTLYNVFLPVLQFSPVSIIPPLFHTHSSIYHPHCITFFSQYFSFPLSVSFHHCSILRFHSSTIDGTYC